MSREPGQAPQFDRLLIDLGRAKSLWDQGNHEAAERMLRLISSIALAESSERGPNDAVPECEPVITEDDGSGDPLPRGWKPPVQP